MPKTVGYGADQLLDRAMQTIICRLYYNNRLSDDSLCVLASAQAAFSIPLLLHFRNPLTANSPRKLEISVLKHENQHASCKRPIGAAVLNVSSAELSKRTQDTFALPSELTLKIPKAPVPQQTQTFRYKVRNINAGDFSPPFLFNFWKEWQCCCLYCFRYKQEVEV